MTDRHSALGWPVLLAVALLAAPVRAEDVTVFAAASLTDAMTEIEPLFEDAGPHDLTVVLAGSSVLARQIQAGAPADIFLSANPDWMDVLQDDGLIAKGTRRDLLGNRLVLVAHDPDVPPIEIGPETDLGALLGGGRLAMALVDAVPAGLYGKAALQALGLWSGIEAQVVQSDNVRAALALVATGEAPLGIVYATDAEAQPRVTVAGTFPAESHPPIVYPVAAIAGRAGPAEAAFLDFLATDDARAAFERQGFSVMTD